MSRRFLAWIPGLLFALALVLGGAGVGRAQSNDPEVEALVDSVLEAEFASGRFAEALEKLDLAKQACEGGACSPPVRARVLVAIGTIFAAGLGKPKEAKQAFVAALREHPAATLLPQFASPEADAAFAEAKAAVASAGSAPSAVRGGAKQPPKRTCDDGGRPPRGWRNAAAACYYQGALDDEAARDWLECARSAHASLALENRATTRFLAASCEERAGLWVDAASDFQVVADAAGRAGLYDTAAQARKRLGELREKIPKLVIRKPAKAQDLVVKLDGEPLSEDRLGGEIWVDPGQRTITATGKVDGVELEFEQVTEVAEFETATVEIRLVPKGARLKDREVLQCMIEAKTRDDFARCVSQGGGGKSNLTVRVGSEFSAYHDSDHVDVITPALFATIEEPTAGWGVGGSFLVDVVTAASVDILATASPRWTEVRYVPGLSGHKKFGDVDTRLRASASVEPDYLGTAVGAVVSADLFQKRLTPSIAYDFGYDLSGRAGTSFDVFSRTITRHGIDVSASIVLDKSTLLAASLTAIFEDGDTSKPYRYIPMFSPEIAALIQPGQSIQSVNQYRLPERVLEQLPTDRQRWAVAARVAHRFTSSTIRVDERLYIDNWGVKATTTDAKFFADVTSWLRLWPHARLHAQGGADFWRVAYASERTPAGLKVPAIRTGDKELGPLLSLTLGGGARLAFGEKKNWGLNATVDVVYTRFFEHLFILQRLGYFGALSLEVELE